MDSYEQKWVTLALLPLIKNKNSGKQNADITELWANGSYQQQALTLLFVSSPILTDTREKKYVELY